MIIVIFASKSDLHTPMEEKHYPVGFQTFEEIRKENKVYVDKTAYIYNLVTTGKYYFLSRPRRFGKSLLLSTIESLYQGERELFAGLFIDEKEWRWEKYPVFHLDLSGNLFADVSSIDKVLGEYISVWETRYGSPHPDMEPNERFRTLIREAHEKSGKKVVILIDEYDYPLIKTLESEELQEGFRKKLQAFYGNLKTMDQYIEFGMLTGVTKFSKVNVFSGLNNLNDISLDEKYNAICGISESELRDNFQAGVLRLAEKQKVSKEDIQEKLKEDYDGYHFSIEGEGIYNPFSLLNTFEKKRFSDYWFESGTPEMLVTLLKTRDYKLYELSGSRCAESDLKGSDILLANPIPLLYQAGYLTIKGYDKEFCEYILDFPNREVKEGFFKYLVKFYMPKEEIGRFSVSRLVNSVRNGDAETFMENMQSFFSEFPYDQLPNLEVHYQNVMYIVMKLMGYYVKTEYKTSRGRIDMVIKTHDYIYVIELKLNGTAEDAIRQIEERGYCYPFKSDGRKIIQIGASFSAKTHELDEYIIR